MKKCCKSVDITDRNFIKRCIMKCLKGGRNGKSKLNRPDTLRMFQEYSGVPMSLLKKIAKDHIYYMFGGIIETVVDGIRHEILNEEFIWKPIWYTTRRDNGKLRRIGIQDIKQQLYDYIAVEGLAEVLQKIGFYQCAAIPGKGQVMGMRAIKRWLRNKGIRYAWKGDARHYYENIDIDRLKELLERYVDNKLLLKLVFALIDSFDKGLSIGSYLSQYLANFYMSFAYHHATENLFKIRKHKNGMRERVNLIVKAIFYMDDILFLGNSLKDLKMGIKQFRAWIWDGQKIELKEPDQYIDLRTGYIDMMGFLISRKKVIVRPRIFRRFRRDIKEIRKTGIMTKRQAKRLISLDGWPKNAQCKHFCKRNKVYELIATAKEMISDGKDIIFVEDARNNHNSTSGRKEGCNRSDERGRDHSDSREFGERDHVSVRRKQIPDSV